MIDHHRGYDAELGLKPVSENSGEADRDKSKSAEQLNRLLARIVD